MPHAPSRSRSIAGRRCARRARPRCAARRPATPASTAICASSPRPTSTATSPRSVGGDAPSSHQRSSTTRRRIRTSSRRTRRDQLALSQADIVIENGGGYDDFIDTLLDGVGQRRRVVINAVERRPGCDADADGFNEHVWYDFRRDDRRWSTQLADALGEVDPDERAASTRTPSADVRAELDVARSDRGRGIAATIAGAGVAITEPVPLYLLEALGLDEPHPAAFSEAIEEGTDVPPALLQTARPDRRRPPRSSSTTSRPAGRRPTPCSPPPSDDPGARRRGHRDAARRAGLPRRGSSATSQAS